MKALSLWKLELTEKELKERTDNTTGIITIGGLSVLVSDETMFQNESGSVRFLAFPALGSGGWIGVSFHPAKGVYHVGTPFLCPQTSLQLVQEVLNLLVLQGAEREIIFKSLQKAHLATCKDFELLNKERQEKDEVITRLRPPVAVKKVRRHR